MQSFESKKSYNDKYKTFINFIYKNGKYLPNLKNNIFRLIYTDEIIFSSIDLDFCKDEWDYYELYPWYFAWICMESFEEFLVYYKENHWIQEWELNDFQKKVKTAIDKWDEFIICFSDLKWYEMVKYNRKQVVEEFKKEWKLFGYELKDKSAKRIV